MKFGPVPPEQALGATAVHTIRKGELVLKKGTVIDASHVAALKAAGIADVVVARLDTGDVSEDAAAAAIADAVTGEGVRADRAFTGRSNLFADRAGILLVDRAQIDAMNRIDEAVTLATLPAYKPVVEGEMLATVKIIPFAVGGEIFVRAMKTAQAAKPLVRVAPYKIRKVGVVSTLLPGLSPKVIDKTLKITEERLAPAGARIVAERRVPHDQQMLAKAIPAAIEAVGGSIEHFGMPVDPGNLMLIGTAHGRPVLGAPGCARSPKENGFDWVLMRLLAGLPVSREDITGMGVGGLLMEIVTRPQPREEPSLKASGRFAAVILAAGRSTRMGGPNKLLAEITGKPLARIAAEAALKSQARPVVVVTGHQGETLREALSDLPLEFVENADFAEGLSTSLRAGISALPADIDGAVVMLADMPQVDQVLIDRLISAHDPEKGALIAVPVLNGKRGNPVLWSRRFFPELTALEGDVGARHLIGKYGEAVVEVPVSGQAALTDVDTPDALRAVKAELERR
jgi:molybdenum cofactor cytidylyltransferase